MKAALLYGKDDLRVVELDTPDVGPDDILVKVKVCAVCPTDIRKYRTGNHGVDRFPMNLGHEWTGEVVKAGKRVKGFNNGMRVIGAGFAGYAEYAKIPQIYRELGMVLEIPANVSYEEGAFLEPLADCLHAVRDQARAKAGETTVIIGAGQMGLQLSMVAKSAGATVIVSEFMKKRVEYAERFGADYAINAAEEDPIEVTNRITQGRGADSVIVSIGHPLGIGQGLKMVKKGGRVVLFAGAPEGTTVQLDPNIIHYGEVTLTGSFWLGVAEVSLDLYRETLDLIDSKEFPLAELITHRFTLDEIHKAFQVQENREGLKAVIIPP